MSGFDNYLDKYIQIELEIVGKKTINGITISGQSRHFMQRVLGTARDPEILKERHIVVSRSGVSVEEIKETLFHGTPRKAVKGNGGYSQVFVGRACKVSVNPETGTLIQCNPIRKNEKTIRSRIV